MIADLPLMKSVLTLLDKRVLMMLGLTAAMSATIAAIQRKIHWSGCRRLDLASHTTELVFQIKKRTI